jgi:fumarylacetoacetate (FAA) hydrolase
MKLCTLRDGTRDGTLAVVRGDNDVLSPVTAFDSLQDALENWEEAEPVLRRKAEKLESGDIDGQPVDYDKLHSPLPRAYEWVDGSAYINHIVLVRKARGAEPPETLKTDPLVYQGGSGHFLGPHEDIPLYDEEWGLDFEGEIAVVMGDTPRGVSADEAEDYIRLVGLANDVTYRNIIPDEIAKSFGFFQSKPATAFSPFFVTPDELGDDWKNGRLHKEIEVEYDGEWFGNPNAGPEMHFSFHDLIEHITKTRSFTAGTLLGSGTVSNEDESNGSSCLAEKRMIEKIETGEFQTPFMRDGETVRIDMKDEDGTSIFGPIDQKVVDA